MIGSEAPGLGVIARARHCDDEKASETREQGIADDSQCIDYDFINIRTQGRANSDGERARAIKTFQHGIS